MAKLKDLLTVDEVASELEFNLKAVYYLIETQEINADVYFGELRVYIEDLMEFMENYDFIPDYIRNDIPNDFWLI